MTQIFCLTKEDISTSKIGNHIVITTKEGLQINFNKEAMLELLNDFIGVLNTEVNTILKRQQIVPISEK